MARIWFRLASSSCQKFTSDRPDTALAEALPLVPWSPPMMLTEVSNRLLAWRVMCR